MAADVEHKIKTCGRYMRRKVLPGKAGEYYNYPTLAVSMHGLFSSNLVLLRPQPNYFGTTEYQFTLNQSVPDFST